MDLLRLHFDTQSFALSFEVSAWLIILLVWLALVGAIMSWYLRRYKVVKLDIMLGKIGKVELVPNNQDLQIAHCIWTELVTRKAAIPIDPNHDVIVEVYHSWYALFTRVRELISNLPADLVRKEKSTQKIVKIATKTLNDGLRPHLTKWQALFTNWYNINREKLAQKCPQELQKEFPEYAKLVSDIREINYQLIQYADELKKIVDG